MTIYYKKEDITIRSMIKGDAEQLSRGFAEQGWHKSEEQFLNYLNQQEKKEKLVIVAEFEGKPVGYVTLLPFAQIGPYSNKNIPEIVDFNVLIKYRNRGIGNAIMNVAEGLAKEKRNCVSLSVGLHNGYGTAQRMYVKRGYIPDGTGVWYNGKQLEQYVSCVNDDDLVLYFLKDFTV